MELLRVATGRAAGMEPSQHHQQPATPRVDSFSAFAAAVVGGASPRHHDPSSLRSRGLCCADFAAFFSPPARGSRDGARDRHRSWPSQEAASPAPAEDEEEADDSYDDDNDEDQRDTAQVKVRLAFLSTQLRLEWSRSTERILLRLLVASVKAWMAPQRSRKRLMAKSLYLTTQLWTTNRRLQQRLCFSEGG